ncbi:lipopolysaccharide biosynthesis protein [Acinetobacter johnsonii]|jgi:hypothetical protein|uniref:lipopolysaccharide biosynthesis protein n=1 Tax=Acinetobacter johnsonii TaxID=40214 RepID=UPI00301652AB
MISKKLQTLQLFFSNLCFRNIYKVVYKLSNSNQYKHNRRFWPYYQVERDTENGLQKLFFKQKLVVDNTQAVCTENKRCMMIATGPSVQQIPPETFTRSDIDYVGLNGAISMPNVVFKHYVIIDHNFVESRFDLVLKVLNSNCTFYTTPRCLDLILRKVLFQDIQCNIRVVEPITRGEIEPMLQPKKAVDMQKNYFYTNNQLGFSTQIYTAIFDYFTVAYIALQIIHSLRYQEIYLAGLDMNNFTQPRFYESAENKQPTLLDRSLDFTLPAFDLAAQFFKAQGITVYNLSEHSAVEAFPKINAKELFKSQ